MEDFDYFLRRLIDSKACESPSGFKYYDAL
jgi:hypothetical protein